MIQKYEFKRRRRKHTHYILCFFVSRDTLWTNIDQTCTFMLYYTLFAGICCCGGTMSTREILFLLLSFTSSANSSQWINTAVSSRADTTAPRAQGSGGCAGLYIMYLYSHLYICTQIYIFRSIACFVHVDGTPTLQNPTQQTRAMHRGPSRRQNKQ